MEGVECRKCNTSKSVHSRFNDSSDCFEVGHFSKDCPNAEAMKCRNCGEEGHISKECDKPRDPSTMTCHNCDKKGHMSKECPKPRDYSRVKCSECGESMAPKNFASKAYIKLMCLQWDTPRYAAPGQAQAQAMAKVASATVQRAKIMVQPQVVVETTSKLLLPTEEGRTGALQLTVLRPPKKTAGAPLLLPTLPSLPGRGDMGAAPDSKWMCC